MNYHLLARRDGVAKVSACEWNEILKNIQKGEKKLFFLLRLELSYVFEKYYVIFIVEFPKLPLFRTTVPKAKFRPENRKLGKLNDEYYTLLLEHVRDLKELKKIEAIYRASAKGLSNFELNFARFETLYLLSQSVPAQLQYTLSLTHRQAASSLPWCALGDEKAVI